MRADRQHQPLYHVAALGLWTTHWQHRLQPLEQEPAEHCASDVCDEITTALYGCGSEGDTNVVPDHNTEYQLVACEQNMVLRGQGLSMIQVCPCDIGVNDVCQVAAHY